MLYIFFLENTINIGLDTHGNKSVRHFSLVIKSIFVVVVFKINDANTLIKHLVESVKGQYITSGLIESLV